ncbi:unnamed protein product, partial [Timema podura]|nr:unnamed protein product [Timema podura]
MNSLLRSVVSSGGREIAVKESLVVQLSNSVKQIQLEQTQKNPFSYGCDDTASLCTVLEAIFIHGLKETFINRVTQVIGTDPDQRPEPSFWGPLLVFSHREIIDQISHSNRIHLALVYLLTNPLHIHKTMVVLVGKSLQAFRVALFGGSLQTTQGLCRLASLYQLTTPQGKSPRQFTPLASEEHRTLEFLRPEPMEAEEGNMGSRKPFRKKSILITPRWNSNQISPSLEPRQKRLTSWSVFPHKVNSLNLVTTDVGRCRAWLRLALNDCLLSSYLGAMRRENSALKPYYRRSAFVCDSELLDVVQRLVEGIESCLFSFTSNSSLLNIWTNSPLLLAGLWMPPMRPCPIPSGVDVASTLNYMLDEVPASNSILSYSPASSFGPILACSEDEALKIILGTPVDEAPIARNCRLNDNTYSDESECTQVKNIPLQQDDRNKATTSVGDGSSSFGNSLIGRVGWSSSFQELPNKQEIYCDASDQTGQIAPHSHMPSQNRVTLLRSPSEPQSYHSLLESYNLVSGGFVKTPDLRDFLHRFDNASESSLDMISGSEAEAEAEDPPRLHTPSPRVKSKSAGRVVIPALYTLKPGEKRGGESTTSLYRHHAFLNSGPVVCVELEGRSRGLALWLPPGRTTVQLQSLFNFHCHHVLLPVPAIRFGAVGNEVYMRAIRGKSNISYPLREGEGVRVEQMTPFARSTTYWLIWSTICWHRSFPKARMALVSPGEFPVHTPYTHTRLLQSLKAFTLPTICRELKRGNIPKDINSFLHRHFFTASFLSAILDQLVARLPTELRIQDLILGMSGN